MRTMRHIPRQRSIARGGQWSSSALRSFHFCSSISSTFHSPQLEYVHLLVTYHLGFAKRALIGTVVSLFASRVPVSYVYIIGASVWVVALLLFIFVFKRVLGFSEKNLPLFAFVAGSPF